MLIKFVRRHPVWTNAIVGVSGFLSATFASIWVELASPGLKALFPNSNFAFVWLLAAAFVAVAPVALVFAAHGLQAKQAAVKEQLQCLLQATGQALVHPKDPKRYPLRAACRIWNRKSGKLDPFCQWSQPVCNDENLSVDCSGPDKDVLVICRVFRDGVTRAEELPQDHNSLLAGDHRGRIWSEIRCVLAAAIRDPLDKTAAPIGTISFDSSMPLERVKFQTDEAKRLAELVASLAYGIISQAE